MKLVQFAEPKMVDSLDDCDFYHTMDLPGAGFVRGQWDLRGHEADYLGHAELSGKTVLEIGTASGHLCFYMERMGAQVVAFDLNQEIPWDIVPHETLDMAAANRKRAEHICRLNNSFWFAYAAFHSQAKVVYGSVYKLPDNLGLFEIGTMGSVLLHLRDPFLAMQRVSARVSDTIIVTDLRLPWRDELLSLFRRRPLLNFLPTATCPERNDGWWQLSPGMISRFLSILGFTHTEVFYHEQLYHGREIPMFTVVGRRKPRTSGAVHYRFSAGRFLTDAAQLGLRLEKGVLRRLGLRK